MFKHLAAIIKDIETNFWDVNIDVLHIDPNLEYLCKKVEEKKKGIDDY